MRKPMSIYHSYGSTHVAQRPKPELNVIGLDTEIANLWR